MDEVIKGKKISGELIHKINELYNSGKSSREVAKEVGVSKTTVLEYVKPKTNRLTDEERKANRVKSVTKRRQTLKKLAIDYKGGSCQRCGYNKCDGALEFHHLDPTKKDFSISSSGNTRAWEVIKKELDKCIMVCANCHREIHEEERNKKAK